MKKNVAILLTASLLSSCGSLSILPKPIDAPKTVLTAEEVAAQTTLWRKHFTDSHLQRLVADAIAGNNDLKIAYQRVKAARSRVTAARGALAPNVSAGTGAGLQKYGYYTMDNAGNRTTPIYNEQIIPQDLPDFNVGLQAAWEVDIWGKLRSERGAAMSRVLASEAGRRFVLASLLSDLTTHYYDLVALDTTLPILDDNIKIQQDALTAVQAQKAAGVANALAIEQFEARLYKLRGMKIEAELEITDHEAAMRLLLGNSAHRITRTQTALTQLSAPRLSRNVPSSLLTQRPDVRQAELEAAAAQADVKAARTAFLPSLDITGALGFQAFRGDLLLNSHSAAYSVAGGLMAPLINRAAIKAKFQAASATELEALASYQQAIVNAYVEVYNLQAKIRLYDQLADVKRHQVQLLEQSVATSSSLFNTRRVTYLDVLNAQQTTLDGRLELVDVRKRQFQMQVLLYKAVGGG